ncbi:MAG: hypothetical protein KBT03_04025 [Bacteroidales bacterium]|nr:hypothetical protein [Candidatus Scybalousia scybalohippi]
MIFKGTIGDIAQKYGYSTAKINEIIKKKNLLKSKYRIIKYQQHNSQEQIDNSLYGYIKRNILIYDNTVCEQDPQQEIKRLKKEGILIKCTHLPPLEIGGKGDYLLERYYEKKD